VLSSEPPLPPEAFSPKERRELDLLPGALIVTVVVFIVSNALKSNAQFEHKILLFTLGAAIIAVTFLFTRHMYRLDHAEWLRQLHEGTLVSKKITDHYRRS